MTYTPTEQANIELVQRLFASEETGDWDTYFACFAPEAVIHVVGRPDIAGLEAFRDVVTQSRSMFSTIRHSILDMSADGENVVFRWRFHPVVRATGKQTSWEGLHWMKVRDGLIEEDWNYADPAEVQSALAEAMAATR